MKTVIVSRCRASLLALCFVSAPACAGVAEIVSLTGKGEFRAPAETSWNVAKLKQALDPGHFVRTGDLSSMAILFADKTQMRLSQNSMFQVKAAEKPGDATINLRRGRAWTQAKNTGGQLLMETPSAIAAIHGTDWEMEVDEEGRTRLTVLHGVVEFYNAQGSVTVRNHEQALAEKGKAPVKLLLQNPAERMQWVTAYAVDAARYPELHAAALNGESDESRILREVAGLLRNQGMKEARDRLHGLVQSPRLASPVSFLLLADFAIHGGELRQAEEILRQGKQRFPGDTRLDAQLARVALYRDDAVTAREVVRAALARYPDAPELRLAQGEIARFDGDARLASAAYRKVIEHAPQEVRGWHGLGVVESEREETKSARPHLLKALALDEKATTARGELATLETFANNLEAAHAHFARALQDHPDDYVALTGLGLLQLKTGDTAQALETLLKASVIEPKYARAVVYSAVAYYQSGRHRVALETLAHASELDQRDPLPYQLASLIYTDQVEPGKALDAAREAMRRLPWQKSLNQLANDQKGAANLGNALAQFGLEEWALNYAQESYDPFWAGSHLFLADRYTGKFNKQSELMQGFLTDPTAFGASNRFQTLLAKPGNYFSAGVTASHSDDQRSLTPLFIANGYANGNFPLAYFAEGLRVNLVPGAQAIDGAGTVATAALGLAPREDLGFFAFANSFEAGIDNKMVPQFGQRLSGRENRLDIGMNYKFSPISQSWLKMGGGEESARIDTADRRPGQNADIRYDYQPRNQDVQYRHSMRLDNDEWSWGVENARMDKTMLLSSASGRTQIRDEISDLDKSWSIWLADRHRLNDKLLDVGMHWQHYEKTSDSHLLATQGAYSYPYNTSASYMRKGINPRLGVVWTPATGTVWRFAWQKWLRPIASNSLAPVATAGIALDDQTVLPGGELERLRFQFEHEFSANTFAALFYDTRRIHNLGDPGNVLNQREEVANLDRLRNRAAQVFQNNGEALEQQPTFLQGRLHSAGASLNRRLGDNLSAFASYVYTESENTHDWFSGFKLPWMPRHRVTLGTTWAGPQRLLIQTAAVYRGQRYTNEDNSSELAPGWDASMKASWQSADKRWLVEGYMMNLLKKESTTTLGVNGIWRY